MLFIFILKLRGLVPAHSVMAWMKSLCFRQSGHTHHTTVGCILKVELNQSRWGEIQCSEEPCVNESCMEMMSKIGAFVNTSLTYNKAIRGILCLLFEINHQVGSCRKVWETIVVTVFLRRWGSARLGRIDAAVVLATL